MKKFLWTHVYSLSLLEASIELKINIAWLFFGKLEMHGVNDTFFSQHFALFFCSTVFAHSFSFSFVLFYTFLFSQYLRNYSISIWWEAKNRLEEIWIMFFSDLVEKIFSFPFFGIKLWFYFYFISYSFLFFFAIFFFVCVFIF